MAASPIKVFISYAHEDEPFQQELVKHLSNLQTQGVVEGWHDRQIIAGQQWADKIDLALNNAQIILLLISASFMASKYCREIEMRRAKERHEANEAIVIPILIRQCDWAGAPFSELQAHPKDAKPVQNWTYHDDAWTDVVGGIRKAIEKLLSPPPPPPPSSKPGGSGLPYLCDRSDQEEELRSAWRLHQSRLPRRPLLCIIHGDEFECHDKFIERLKDDLLPTLLPSKQIPEEYYWYDPPPLSSTADQFRHSFEERFLATSANSVEEWQALVKKMLEAHTRPLYVHIGWLTENCERGGAGMFSSFLQFWEDWPPVNCPVICGLSLTYQRSKEVSSRFSFWRKSPNDRLRQLVQTVKPNAPDKLSLVVLSELQSINRKQAEDWPSHPKVDRNFALPKDRISELYRRYDDRPIAMEKLAKIIPILHELTDNERDEEEKEKNKRRWERIDQIIHDKPYAKKSFKRS